MKNLLLLVGMLVCAGAWGQKYERLHAVRNYTAIDGLPQSQVTCLLEDENGYLWVGTEGGGLARFDGREFKVYSTNDGLLTNFITGLRFDRQGNLWILHPRGLTKFNGVEFKRFSAPGTTTTSKRQRNLFLLGDTLFVVNFTGALAKVHNDSVYYWNRSIVPNAEVTGSFQGRNGTVCHYLADGRFYIVTHAGSFFIGPHEKLGRRVNFFDHNDEIWVNTINGTYSLDVANRRLVRLPFQLPRAVLFYDANGGIFWSTNQATIFADRVVNNEVHSDTIFKEVEPFQITRDSEGNIWIASNSRGLFKYYEQDFNRCTTDKMGAVMSILVDRSGASWIGTMGQGLYKMSNGKSRHFSYDDVPYRNSIHAVKESPDGDVWIGSAGGLGRFDPVTGEITWYTMKDSLVGNNIMSINFDEQGGLWTATSMGVDYYDGKSHRHFTVNQGLNTNMVWAATYMPHNQTYYVGTEFGLNTIHDNHVGVLNIPELENTLVLSIQPYRDSLLLVGSGGGGVLVYNPKTRERKAITKKDGLNSDFVYFVAADNPFLWIGTERGMSRIRLNPTLDVVEHLYYDQDNGLTGIETNQNAYFIDKKHKYFGLVDGLYEFNDRSNIVSSSFDLHLTAVQLLYGEYDPVRYGESVAGFFKIPTSLSLPTDRNHLTFHYNRVDKRYPNSVKFKYYLENFDKGWSLPSSNTSVTYSNLPPGEYVFRVMATNGKGYWSDDIVSYPFTVLQPFYTTASFVFGTILFLAGAVTLLLYIRVRQRVRKVVETERIRMLEMENLRKEIARDFHDEMGNQLTRIINYISLLKLRYASQGHPNGSGNGNVAFNGNTLTGTDLYTKVEESAKYLYTGTRDFIWAIDPGNDELSKLFIHIRDFGEKLFEEKTISFRAFNQVKDNQPLPNGFSREANLIFKEVMTNAFKYSNASNVTLALDRDPTGAYLMMFEDDGEGFCTDQIQKSNGLKNIRVRAEKINAVLRIHSEKGRGTQVSLHFTIKKPAKHGVTI